MEEPKRRKDLSESALPRARKSRTERLLPSRATPYKLIALPRRAKDRSESVLPRLTKSKTDKEDPILMIP
jgi:hypothetical protein